MRERAPHHQRRLIRNEDVREIAVSAQSHDLGRAHHHRALWCFERDHPLCG
jgi:hypothetical protein